MTDMMNFPDLTRNIAIVGHLHHGKTSFVDMLVSETHDVPVNVDQPVCIYIYTPLTYVKESKLILSKGTIH